MGWHSVNHGQQGKFAWTLQTVTSGVKLELHASERVRLYQLNTTAGQHVSQIFLLTPEHAIDFE